MINGIITAVLLLAFAAIVLWAWSPRQQPRFDEAKRLALDDSEPPADGNRRKQAPSEQLP